MQQWIKRGMPQNVTDGVDFPTATLDRAGHIVVCNESLQNNGTVSDSALCISTGPAYGWSIINSAFYPGGYLKPFIDGFIK
jgi:hypothetical protein